MTHIMVNLSVTFIFQSLLMCLLNVTWESKPRKSQESLPYHFKSGVNHCTYADVKIVAFRRLDNYLWTVTCPRNCEVINVVQLCSCLSSLLSNLRELVQCVSQTDLLQCILHFQHNDNSLYNKCFCLDRIVLLRIYCIFLKTINNKSNP